MELISFAAHLLDQPALVSDLGSCHHRAGSVPEPRQCPEPLPGHERDRGHEAQRDHGGGGQPRYQVHRGYSQLRLSQRSKSWPEGISLLLLQRGVSEQ